MEIEEVESFAISIPLDEPVRFSIRTIDERDHAIVYVRASDGTEGLGYSLGYGGAHLIADAVEDILAPMLEGEDPRDTERLWRAMFDETVQIGRMGLMQRAISCVDVALWDLKSKAAGEPLYKYLGAHSDEVPAYVTGGYYREGKGLEGLREEVGTYVDRGHDVVKIKVGGESVERDAERVRVAREAIGDERTLLLDANGKYRNKQEAVTAGRAFGEYDPYFLEEPVMPDSYALMSEVNAALDYPVAAGELEFNRYGFERLLREDAVEVVQADVTVTGGITEWIRIAGMASAEDVPMAPHYNWDLHAHMVAAVENSLWVEYFYRDSDVKAFDDVVEYPLEPNDDGTITLPDRPGHGVVLDRDHMERFLVE